MDLKIFQLLEFMNNRLTNIEKRLTNLDEKVEFSLALQRNHLIRIKNNENIDDNIILYGNPYNDLSPQQAYHIISDPDRDFILLDVSKPEFKKPFRFEATIEIPLEQLKREYVELESKTLPILVISEKGLRSIQACELLIRRGYYNVNNISGGYAYYPMATKNDQSSASPE